MSITENDAVVALSEANGTDFEKFCQCFLAALEGANFVPLGGTHDGGADGFAESSLFELENRADHFYQFTVQADHRSKIRKTAIRLKNFGRTLRAITYMTSRDISHIDVEEDDLSDELNTRVRIRDRKYITTHLNDSTGTQAAFKIYLEHYLARYTKPGAATIIPNAARVQDPSVYVFLEQEVENRLGNADLIRTISDSLILWSLSDTDPDKNIFMTRENILEKILSTVPWAKQFINSTLDSRLIALASKQNTSGREVRWHRKEGLYCLPFETRKLVSQENTRDLNIKLDVIGELRNIAIKNGCDDFKSIELACELSIRTIELFFEKEGLKFSHFLNSHDEEFSSNNTISDRIDEVFEEKRINQQQYKALWPIVTAQLRQVFFYSTERQREYLYHLSRTYILLFSLQAEPRIIEYFQGMTSSFKLYVGSDIIIRALSERYLSTEDQQTRNMLTLAHAYGVKLMLSEPILEEIYTHLQGTNYEFVNHMAEIEPYINIDYARHSPKILIRTYFYAKEKSLCSGWKTFMGQFLSYQNLWGKGIGGKEGREELREYLTTQFHLEYISKEEIEEAISIQNATELANKLVDNGEKRENFDLAYNDALMVLGVYGLRKRNKETTKVTEYGYQTWWLTQETRIQKYTAELVMENGAKYILRPEFLLNYFALCPNKQDVLQTYRNIFPTAIGIQMGHRLNEQVFHKILGKVTEWKELEDGRRTSRIQRLGDRLKTDQIRKYQRSFTTIDDHINNELL